MRKVTDPKRGRTKKRGKNPRRLAAAGRITASAPAATGCQENRQAEAEASPEGECGKAKKTTCRQEAEQSRWTWERTYGQGSTMERTKNPHDPQLQRGPPGKRAPAAAGRKSSHRPRYKTPAGRRRAGHPRQPQTLSKGRGGNPEPQHGTGKNTGGS